MAKRVISHLISSSSSPKSVIPSVSFSRNYFPSSPVHHTLSESMMEEIIENAESIITKWDTNSSSYNKVVSLFQQNRKEAKEFIKCVKDLRRAMHFLVSEHGHSEKLKLAQNLMQVAMARLEKEFYQILSSNRDQLDPESVSGQSSNGSTKSEYEDDDESGEEELTRAGETISKVERSAALVMSDLKAIAECMINCGYGKECVKIYKLIRKSIIDEGLHMLDFGKHKASQIPRMNWDALDPVIKNWVKAIKIGVTTLFRGEKLLCDHVFSSSKAMRENCFYEIINEEATKLLQFPELVATRKKSPERILRLMDLYEAITEVWQDLELIFHFELVAGVRLQALSSLQKLADSISSIVRDFEFTIQKNSSKTLVPGGGIHPLTRSAIRFLSSLADHSSVLSEILKEHPLKRSSSMPESYFRNQIHNNEPDKSLTLSPEAAKDCFRRFHAAFEEVYMTQSSCIVTDGKLRDELKISIANKLVPEYRGFYERYLGILSQEKNMEMLVRFNPDNLENYLSDLFHGTPIMSGYSSSSSSSSSCSSQGCLRG